MLVLMGRSAEADTSGGGGGRIKGLIIRRSGWRSEVCRVSPQIPQTIADKKLRNLRQGQDISSTECSFRYTYQIIQLSNEVKFVSKVSEF